MSSEESAMQAARQERAASSAQTPAGKTDRLRYAREDNIKSFSLRRPLCVAPSSSLAEVVARMNEAEEDCAFVCQDKRIVGIFTERDFLIRIIGENLDTNEPVERWMTKDVCTLTSDSTLGDVVRVMSEAGCRTIPVVEDGNPIGAISVLDVITYLAESYPKETMNLPPVPAQVMDTPEGG